MVRRRYFITKSLSLGFPRRFCGTNLWSHSHSKVRRWVIKNWIPYFDNSAFRIKFRRLQSVWDEFFGRANNLLYRWPADESVIKREMRRRWGFNWRKHIRLMQTRFIVHRTLKHFGSTSDRCRILWVRFQIDGKNQCHLNETFIFECWEYDKRFESNVRKRRRHDWSHWSHC